MMRSLWIVAKVIILVAALLFLAITISSFVVFFGFS